MKNDTTLNDFLNLLTENLSDEELLLSKLQAEIAASISAARIRKGISQAELAKELNVTQALVSRWENGDTNFTIQTLVRIALKLDIEMKSPYVSQTAYLSVSGSVQSPWAKWTATRSHRQKNGRVASSSLVACK